MGNILPIQRHKTRRDTGTDYPALYATLTGYRPTHDDAHQLLPLTHKPWCDKRAHNGQRNNGEDWGCFGRTHRYQMSDGTICGIWVIEQGDGATCVVPDFPADGQPWSREDFLGVASLLATVAKQIGAVS